MELHSGIIHTRILLHSDSQKLRVATASEFTSHDSISVEQQPSKHALAKVDNLNFHWQYSSQTSRIEAVHLGPQAPVLGSVAASNGTAVSRRRHEGLGLINLSYWRARVW